MRVSRQSWIVTVGIALVALLASMLSVIGQPAPAQAAVTGDGGQYVWSYGRVLDTRDGTGGFSTPMPANTERKIQVGGTAGVPDDASAVVLSATVVHPGGQGILRAKPDRDTPSAMVMVYGGGGLDTMSNMVTVPIGDDGKVTFTATTTVDLVLNVQGYYTSTDGGVTPGGFVVGTGKEAANTTNGTGLPQQKIGAGKRVDIQITGDAAGVDVPANASGIVANFLVLSRDGNAGLIKPYAAGGTEGSVGMSYPAATTSAMSAHVALSGDGKITVYNQWGIIDLVVEIQGYFTQSNAGGIFTPAAGNIYDTRSGSAVPSGLTRGIQVSGQEGVPQMGAGVSAVAVTLTAINKSANAGTATLWASGTTRPSPQYSVTFGANTTRSNTAIVPLGKDGRIQLWNSGPGAVDYLVELQGWYADPQAPVIVCPVADGGSSVQIPTSISCTVSLSSAAQLGDVVTTFVDGEPYSADLNTNQATTQAVSVPAVGGAHELESLIQNANGIVSSRSDYSFVLGGNWDTAQLLPSPVDGALEPLNPTLSVTPERDEFTADSVVRYTVRAGSATGDVVVQSNWVSDSFDIAAGLLESGTKYWWSAEIVGTPAGASDEVTRVSQAWSFTTEQGVNLTVLGDVEQEGNVSSAELAANGVSPSALEADQISTSTGKPAFDPSLPAPIAGGNDGQMFPMEALPSDIAGQWVSADARTVYLRRGALQKIVKKHAIDAGVVKVVTEKSSDIRRDKSPTVRIYYLRASDISCYVWGCRVKRSTNVKAVVDYRAYLGKTKGVITTYCPGTTKCPSYVKNALNK